MYNGVGKHNIHSANHHGLAEGQPVGSEASSGRGRTAAQLTTDDILGERFLDRFIRYFTTPENGCWLWTASVDAYGYGQIARSGGRGPIKAHRAAWILKYGPITSEQHVLHRCDTPACVNPAHLFLGDQAANMKDAADKRRLRKLVPHPRPRARQFSDETIQIILTTQQYRGVVNQLARRFGISKAYVSLLRRGLRARTTHV